MKRINYHRITYLTDMIKKNEKNINNKNIKYI